MPPLPLCKYQRRPHGAGVAGLAAAFGTTLALLLFVESGALPLAHGKYAMVSLVAVKLGITYFVFLAQSRSFELYSHFGGQGRNALLVVIASIFARPYVAEAMPTFVQLVLA